LPLPTYALSLGQDTQEIITGLPSFKAKMNFRNGNADMPSYYPDDTNSF
jgi:hypothetical protein